MEIEGLRRGYFVSIECAFLSGSNIPRGATHRTSQGGDVFMDDHISLRIGRNNGAFERGADVMCGTEWLIAIELDM